MEAAAAAAAAARQPPAVSMPRKLRDGLARLARSEEPREACALLVGEPVREGAGRIGVSGALPATNASDAPETSFSIPSGELIGAYRTAEDKGLAIVGIFHSHPASKAEPSETDREMMQVNPVAWVIYSGPDGGMRAYTAGRGGGAVEQRLTFE